MGKILSVQPVNPLLGVCPVVSIQDVKFFRGQGFTPARALALARAEQAMVDRDWKVAWQIDDSGDGELGDHESWCDVAAAGGQCSHEILLCTMASADGKTLASLGGIIDADRAYARVVVAELAGEAVATIAREEASYCVPLAAGICSNPTSVARRLSRLLNSLEFEVTGYTVEGRILDGITSLKRDMLLSLRAQGWRVDYLETPGKWRVRQAGG